MSRSTVAVDAGTSVMALFVKIGEKDIAEATGGKVSLLINDPGYRVYTGEIDGCAIVASQREESCGAIAIAVMGPLVKISAAADKMLEGSGVAEMDYSLDALRAHAETTINAFLK